MPTWQVLDGAKNQIQGFIHAKQITYQLIWYSCLFNWVSVIGPSDNYTIIIHTMEPQEMWRMIQALIWVWQKEA